VYDARLIFTIRS